MSVDHYLELALRPAPEELSWLVRDTARDHGRAAAYDELVQPALDEIDARHVRGQLDGHAVRRVLDQTELALAGLRVRPEFGPPAVVARVPENARRPATDMLADALGAAGYAVRVLDPGTSFEELVASTAQRAAGLVGLCIDHEEELEGLYVRLRKLRHDLGPDVAILVGGPALRRRREWIAPLGVELVRSVAALRTLAPRRANDAVAVAS